MATQDLVWAVSIGLASSAVVNALLARRRHALHAAAADDRFDLPQKIHALPTPRVGGVGIAAGFAAAILFLASTLPPGGRSGLSPELLALCTVPAFGVGLLEDLTKRVSVPARLAAMVLGALAALTLLGARFDRIDWPAIDGWLAVPWLSVPLTLFALVGGVNAFNIVDGCNGLLGGVACISLVAIGVVALSVGDPALALAAAAMAGAVAGFLACNWPSGRVFAGDGGAYGTGFVVTLLAILLVDRNPSVSPWFGLTACALPVFETVFSMVRRRVAGTRLTQPDVSHLHQLVYRVLCPPGAPTFVPADVCGLRNGLVSPLLWLLHGAAAAAGAAAFDSTPWQVAVLAAFVGAYLVLYRMFEQASVSAAVGGAARVAADPAAGAATAGRASPDDRQPAGPVPAAAATDAVTDAATGAAMLRARRTGSDNVVPWQQVPLRRAGDRRRAAGG